MGLFRSALPASHTGPPLGTENAAAYPPADPGMPFVAVDKILGANEELLRSIRLSYGSDQKTFDDDILALVKRYAAFVHLLPATPDNHFGSPGGLLRMGLEIAFYALQATDGQIFCGSTTITERKNLEPRWRYATFIGGLCSEIFRTLSHVTVTDEKGNEWPPYLLPLAEWLRSSRLSRYFLRWTAHAGDSRSLGIFALPHIIPAATLDHLSKGNSLVVPHMMACISGVSVYRGERNILDSLVKRSAAVVIDRDLRDRAARSGKSTLGSHLQRYLVDAMRRLVAANSAWTPNISKSRVWYSQDGLFVVWPNAVTDMLRLLDSDRLPGIPKTPEAILEILLVAGVLEPTSGGLATWTIFPPSLSDSIHAVKLSSPEILLNVLERALDPLPIELTLPRNAPTSDTPPPAVRAQPPSGVGPTGGKGIKSPPPGRDSPPAEVAGKTSLLGTNDKAPEVEGIDVHEVPAGVSVPRVDPGPPSTLPSNPAYALEAPIRLNPAVRIALAEIVDTLNGEETKHAGWSTASGFFVPLFELERRQIDTSLAIRSLSELSMLAVPAGSSARTVSRRISGEEVIGLVIQERFIVGVAPA
jgi:conjugal transfer pilus assembly protein TraI